MIDAFRQLRPVNILLLALFTLALRLVFIFKLPAALSFEPAEYYAWQAINLPQLPMPGSTGNALMAALLTFAQALWANHIVNKHGLAARQGYLTALLFVLTASLLEPFMVLSAPLLVNFVLLFVTDRLLLIGKMPNAVLPMFDVGLAVGFGTLVYFPFIALMLPVWLALLVYRGFNWREWLAVVPGLLTPFFLLAIIYYWQGILPEFGRILLPFKNALKANFKLSYKDFLVLIPFGAVFVLAVLRLWESFFSSFVLVRKSYQMLLTFIPAVAAAALLKPQLRVANFILTCMPVAAVMAYYFSVLRRRWVYEGLFWLLVVCQQYFMFV